MRRASSSSESSAPAPTYFFPGGGVGADFGAGFWDLVAGGAARGARPRALIDRSITPVWEANHVWLIFVLVVLWTGFPQAFSAIFSTLFVPLTLAALGIVLRGAGFALRHVAERAQRIAEPGEKFAVRRGQEVDRA